MMLKQCLKHYRSLDSWTEWKFTTGMTTTPITRLLLTERKKQRKPVGGEKTRQDKTRKETSNA
jgi:hypothetical protein